MSRMSPAAVPVEETVPDGSSSTQQAPLTFPDTLHGLIPSQIWTILFSESRNRASIGNLIKNMWIELQGVISRPYPGENSFLNWRPLSLAKKVDAISHLSASIVFRVTFFTIMASPSPRGQFSTNRLKRDISQSATFLCIAEKCPLTYIIGKCPRQVKQKEHFVTRTGDTPQFI